MQKIYNNVQDQRVINNGAVCEDVTSVELPDLSHPTTTFETSGMAGAVDFPDMSRMDAASFSISHNNGVNCGGLETPEKHEIEVRLAVQVWNNATNKYDLESAKYRLTGMHTKHSYGTAERGNPHGSTDDFSLTRLEKEVDGRRVTLVDFLTGQMIVNGADYGSKLLNMLD